MIELNDLQVKYGDFVAVKDISIKIETGEFFTFLGPSGCGKTTTLRAIAGFEKPASGSIVAFGVDLSGLLPEERNLGFVFQNYALFPSMNVYENIAYGLKAHKTPKKEIDGKVREVAEKTGITEHLMKKINDLSGGQQQRVAIARALVLEPKILLMDEPLSNLDAKLRVSTREEIRKLQRSFGITTIYVTHDQEEAMAISDRIAVFDQGCLEQVGIYNNPATGTVARFIGDINVFIGDAEAILRKLANFPEGTKLYTRPHKVNIVSNAAGYEGAGVAAIPVVIDSYEFLGAYTKITAKTKDGHPVTSLMFGADTEFDVGEGVFALCSPNNVLALKEA